MDKIKVMNFIFSSQSQPPEYNVKDTSCMCFLNLWGIFTFTLDLFLDILLAVDYYIGGETTYFVLTVCFVTVPAVAISAISLFFYLHEDKSVKVSRKKWIVRAIFLIFCIDPILRNIESLRYYRKTIEAKKKAKQSGKKGDEERCHGRLMMSEYIDGLYLRMFEAFTECGLQLLLQLYIFAVSQSSEPNKFTGTELLCLITALLSLLSMSSSIWSYQRERRNSSPHVNHLSFSVSLFIFLWRTMEILSRVLTLSLFASVMLHEFWAVCAAHFGFMFLWIRYRDTHFCSTWYGTYAFDLVLSVVFTFCYLNLEVGSSRRRMIFFYTLIFLENTALMTVWYLYYPPVIVFKLPVMIVQFLSFALAITLMVFYYVSFHPTIGKRKRDSETGVELCNIEAKGDVEAKAKMLKDGESANHSSDVLRMDEEIDETRELM